MSLKHNNYIVKLQAIQRLEIHFFLNINHFITNQNFKPSEMFHFLFQLFNCGL